MTILLVEDETELARLIVDHLARSGFEVDRAETMSDARAAIDAKAYSLAIVDRQLPDGDGLSVISYLRRKHSGVCILVLTALTSVSDRIVGLDAGADDYIAKPFDIEELLARVRANLRRGQREGSRAPATFEALSFDFDSREAFVHGRPLVLHQRELALLEALVQRYGRVAPRDLLIEKIYGGGTELQSNALDALVSRLRKQLNERDAQVSIQPIRGVGYMMAGAAS
jgi:DNA-binding response OmpR family regulator